MLRSSKPYEALIKRLQQAKTGRKQLSKVSIESQSSSTSTSQTSLKDNWFDELLSPSPGSHFTNSSLKCSCIQRRELPFLATVKIISNYYFIL